MFLSHFFSQKKTKHSSLILEIDSGTVSAGILVEGSKRKDIQILLSPALGTNLLQEKDLPTIVKQNLDFIFESLATREIYIDRVTVIFSSPWQVSRVRDIHVTHERAFIVTLDFLESFKKVEATHLMEESEKGEKQSDVVQEEVEHVRVNGYASDNYIGKRTSVFDASLYLGEVRHSVLEMVRENIFTHTHIHKTEIQVCTSPFVFFKAISEVYKISNPSGNFIFIDIGEEVTDMILGHGGIFISTVSFTSGAQFVIRQISKVLDVSPEIALSTLYLFLHNKADTDLHDRVKTLLVALGNEWLIYFEDAMSSLLATTEKDFSFQIYVSVKEGCAPVYVEFIGSSKTQSAEIIVLPSSFVFDSIFA